MFNRWVGNVSEKMEGLTKKMSEKIEGVGCDPQRNCLCQ